SSLKTHDSAGYFDVTPDDIGEETRRHIVKSLQSMDFKVETSHHEVARGQHEIDFVRENAVRAADYIIGCKFVVRKIASKYGLHATFMPKPLYHQFGSGLHLHQVLESDNKNCFYSDKNDLNLSKEALWFIGGQLSHSRGFCAITNPLINSYKRLIEGMEAPTYGVWSERNTNPIIRIPDQKGEDTRIELRLPDPTCNPYLALSTVLKAGLDGIKNKIDPGKPVNKEVNSMSQRERARLKIEKLPKDLNEATTALRKDKVILEGLGDYIYGSFLAAKQEEWNKYISQIHPWEIEQYFTYY
ncbi:MAG: glutamine synthetase, partial [bacterium]|nr:glutamine synthetase [bacterium]